MHVHAVDHKEPGKEKMPLPSHRQPFGIWDCGPGRKRSPAVVGLTETSCRTECGAAYGRDASHLATVRLHGTDRQQRCVAIGLIAPVERWMCIEALQAAHD